MGTRGNTVRVPGAHSQIVHGDAPVSKRDAVGSKASAVLPFHAGDQTAIRRDDAPPRHPVSVPAQNPADGARGARFSGFGCHFAVGHDVSRLDRGHHCEDFLRKLGELAFAHLPRLDLDHCDRVVEALQHDVAELFRPSVDH